MENGKINWGVIGCGDVVEKKSGPPLSRINNSKLFGVMRRDRDKAADFAKRHNVPYFTNNAEDLIGREEINAIYVATPPSTHRKYTLMAIEKGKAVYVEKPMALNIDECNEMVAAAKSAGVPLYVAYYRRALPKFLKIRELIEKGEIGVPRTFISFLQKPFDLRDPENIPWRIIPEIAGGGLFFDLACHLLDFYDFLFGHPEEVYGMKACQKKLSAAEDSVVAILRYPGNILGTGNWCFSGNQRKDENIITGSEGSITFSNHGNHPIILEKDGEIKKVNYLIPEYIQEPFIEYVVAQLLTKKGYHGNGESAAGINRILENILK